MIKPYPSSPLKFLWLYTLKHKRLMSIILFCATLSILLSKIAPWSLSQIIGLFSDTQTINSPHSKIWNLLLYYILAVIGYNLFKLLTNYLTEIKLQPLLLKEMGIDLFSYLIGHSTSYFADNMAGKLATKVQQIANQAPNIYMDLIYYTFPFGSLIFNFIIFLNLNIVFGLTYLICLCFSIWAALKFGKKTISMRAAMAEARSKVSGNVIDCLQNHFFVKIFNGISHEIKRATKIFNWEKNIVNRSVLTETTQINGQNLYFQILYLAFLFYGFYLWKIEKINSADLVLIFLLMENLSAAATFIIHRTIIYSGILSEIRTNLIPFATPHEITDSENAKELTISEGNINFKNISFTYADKKKIFKNFSLQIPAKQKIGIVGVSGSGKSTLINLLQRFYDIQAGEILIDEQNIKNVTQDSLHKNISFIAQTSITLERSIKDNIAYGKPNANLSQIKEAAQKAFADDFINSLPQGYNTILNEEHKLSGGQLQRISIARALLKDAPILILDEATSALDSEAETYIQNAITELIQNKTVIAIAHRLSTLKHMDRIIVLKHGKIIEDGTIEELLAQKGAFAEFWKLQRLKGKKNE